MTAHTQLFQLIKSLSASEKRYYSLFTQRGGQRSSKLYLQLFSEIDAQVDYDEAALKDHFAGTSFGKGLAFPKTHLYRQVLRALQAFNYEKSTATRFASCLGKVELLSDRGFPDQALRMVSKGLKQALALEQALPVLQLLRWKRRLVLRVQNQHYTAEIARISALEMHWEQLLLHEQQAIRLHDALYLALQEARRKTMPHAAVDLGQLKRELDALTARETLTFEARVACCRARAHHAHLMDDFVSVHQAYQEEVATWQAHPLQRKQDGMRYVRTFGAWLNSKTLIQDYAKLLSEIQGLRRQEGMEAREQALIFRLTYSLELFYYLNSDQLSRAIALAPQIAEGLKRFSSFLSPGFKLGFYHNLAVLFWLGQQPEAALPWTQAILHFEAGEIRKDIREFAPLLEKVLQYECGHVDLLESWFRAFQYQKRKGKPPGRLESMLYGLIRGLVGPQAPTLARDLFTEFLRELAAYAELPEVSKLGLEELRIWGEGKL